jgi:hypothetical protein
MPTIDFSKPSEQQSRWSLFLGILLWLLHLVIVHSVVSVSCKWGGLTVPVGELSALQIFEAAIHLITIILFGFLIYLPWRQWRSFQTEPPSTNPDLMHDTEEYYRPLLAFVAMGLNGFLALYSIASFVPTLALKACGQA